MALIIEGSTPCCLCGEVLNNIESYIGIPPLISNILDSLYQFSDNGVHIDCLAKSKHERLLKEHITNYNKGLPLSKLKCRVDGIRISSPDKLVSLGLLSSNIEDNLYRFNYIDLNRDNIKDRKGREDFLKIVRQYLKDEKWVSSFSKFNYLKYLLEELTGDTNDSHTSANL